MIQGRDNSLEQPGGGRERGETVSPKLDKDWRWVREDGAKTFYLSKRLSRCSVSPDSWVFSFLALKAETSTSKMAIRNKYVSSHTPAGHQNQAPLPTSLMVVLEGGYAPGSRVRTETDGKASFISSFPLKSYLNSITQHVFLV